MGSTQYRNSFQPDPPKPNLTNRNLNQILTQINYGFDHQNTISSIQYGLYNMGLESLSSSVDVLDDLRTITSGSPLFAGWLFGLTRTFISGGTNTF